jgi:diacylglycerol O-acyltransferase 2, plant
MPANRKNISKIFSKGYQCAIIPGGIAEMYLMNDKTEEVFLKTRRNTIKAAIQEGAHILPVFFFGNSKIFHIAGGSGSNSWLARLSRKLRASIVLFYGRNYLPVPLRHPIHIATGDVVNVKQSDNPTAEEIDDVMNRVVSSLEKLYNTQKPDWEDRPLIIK